MSYIENYKDLRSENLRQESQPDSTQLQCESTLTAPNYSVKTSKIEKLF